MSKRAGRSFVMGGVTAPPHLAKALLAPLAFRICLYQPDVQTSSSPLHTTNTTRHWICGASLHLSQEGCHEALRRCFSVKGYKAISICSSPPAINHFLLHPELHYILLKCSSPRLLSSEALPPSSAWHRLPLSMFGLPTSPTTVVIRTTPSSTPTTITRSA